MCLNDIFSKPFKSCLGKDTVQNFINSMLEENKCYCDMMKKRFNKELVMTKKDDEDSKNFIRIKSNHTAALKNYDSSLIMQDLGKFSFKINVIPNG